MTGGWMTEGGSMTGRCWVAHPAASNVPATISDRNFILRSLAALLHMLGGAIGSPPMKLKDITNWSERWSTPLGTKDSHAHVADGVLVGLSLWGTSIIGLAVQCPDGKYFCSIRTPGPIYDHVLEFPKGHHGRKLREVMDAEIDISNLIQ
jgi:hypothetical protein